jgi:diaminopimelate epimerase
MRINRLVIAEPSGNTTALVFDAIAPNQRQFVADLIQQDMAEVEQVMFVIKHGERWHGQMAGKEFCGNAARALGFVLANGEFKSSQTFTMSGLTRAVTVDVIGNQANLRMYTAISHEEKLLAGEPVPVIHLEGISHAVLKPEHKSFHTLRSHAHNIDGNPAHNLEIKAALDELGLTSRLASGLLFLTKDQGINKLAPYVFVRNTQKLYAETACASGSLAAATTIGNGVFIRQPSGKDLHVAWHQKNNGIDAGVSGDMTILWKGDVSDLGNGPKAAREITSLMQTRRFFAAKAG